MPRVATAEVNLPTVRRLNELVRDSGGITLCAVGMPVTRDEARPYMGGNVRDHDKEPVSLWLRHEAGEGGPDLLHYVVEPQNLLRLFGLPVVLRTNVAQQSAVTVTGESDGTYRRFEGVVSCGGQLLDANAVTACGEISVLDVRANTVPAEFAYVLCAVGVSKFRRGRVISTLDS